ncbi:MAG: hypothetical protein QNJ97_18305 [Myxococcota bacterium]|nr:hypothetical protein [Myxococcota bacterium]
MGHKCVVFIYFLGLIGCAAAPPPTSVSANEPALDGAEQAIGIVRDAYTAMGGLERLRLTGGKATIIARARAFGTEVPVEISVSGPEDWRLDYPSEDMSYIYEGSTCRKVIFGILARCTPHDQVWMAPTLLLAGLIFPAGDAANLEASFRLSGEVTLDGSACDEVAIRPRHSNLTLFAAYDRQSKLLKRARFTTVDPVTDQRSKWIVATEDWRDVDSVKVPFRRIVQHNGTPIWEETATDIRLDVDPARFQLPAPPTTDTSYVAMIPNRRVVLTEIDGQQVEVPAPFPTLGGGPHVAGEVKILPEIEALRMIAHSTLAQATQRMASLEQDLQASGRTSTGEPGILVLEQPSAPADTVLMMLYIPIAPK